MRGGDDPEPVSVSVSVVSPSGSSDDDDDDDGGNDDDKIEAVDSDNSYLRRVLLPPLTTASCSVARVRNDF